MNSKSFRLAEVRLGSTSHTRASPRPSPDRSYSDHPPNGASSFFHRIWTWLEVFLGNGQVEVDNNLAENAMRPVALGRKNWLHIGDGKAGPKIASILSVLATCQGLGISAREYLLDVLPRIGTSSAAGVKNLTPQAWAKSRGKPCEPSRLGNLRALRRGSAGRIHLFTKDDDREIDFLQRGKIRLVAPTGLTENQTTARARRG